MPLKTPSVSDFKLTAYSLKLTASILAERIPRERLEPSVVAWAEAGSRRARWSVAFSGGADSLALLLLLWAHWPERRRTLRALHFDHRLRGAASKADAAFCRKISRALGVEFVSGAWKNAPDDASEAAARAARMAFLEEHARVVWFGHQQDDIAETMLMRLARGSGAGGLSAPRPVQRLPGGRVHLRPLLTLKKAELVAALKAAGAAWRDDATNASGRYFRNRIRTTVLPAWAEAAGRDALAGAARSRSLLEEDAVALDAWVDELEPLGPRGVLRLERFADKPRALLRRALHRWLMAEPRAGEISRAAFDALLAALERRRPTRHSLGLRGFAVTDGHVLRFQPARKLRSNFHRSLN